MIENRMMKSIFFRDKTRQDLNERQMEERRAAAEMR